MSWIPPSTLATGYSAEQVVAQQPSSSTATPMEIAPPEATALPVTTSAPPNPEEMYRTLKAVKYITLNTNPPTYDMILNNPKEEGREEIAKGATFCGHPKHCAYLLLITLEISKDRFLQDQTGTLKVNLGSKFDYQAFEGRIQISSDSKNPYGTLNYRCLKNVRKKAPLKMESLSGTLCHQKPCDKTYRLQTIEWLSATNRHKAY